VRSGDIISCHVTTTSCEFQPCRCSNVPKTRLIRLLQPLPGDLRSHHVTSKSLPVTWSHVTSFPVTWLPPPASYSPVGARTNPKVDLYTFYSHFQVTSGQMTSLPVSEVTWHRFLSRDGHLRVSAMKKAQTYPKLDLYAFYRHLQLTSGQMTSFESLPVTLGHVKSFPVTWRPPPASFSPVGAQTYPKLDLCAFYRYFQVTSGEMTSLLDHFWSCEITWRHFLLRHRHLLWVSAL